MKRFLLIIILLCLLGGCTNATTNTNNTTNATTNTNNTTKDNATNVSQPIIAQPALTAGLTDQDIMDAINYGISHKGKITIKDYFIDLGSYKGRLLIITPFLNIATEAKERAEKYENQLTLEEAKKIIEGNSIFLMFTVYGDDIDFAKDYHAVIRKSDGTIIQPTDIFNKDLADTTQRWPDSPAYRANNMYAFPVSVFTSKERVEAIIISPNGKETVYDVDFSKYR